MSLSDRNSRLVLVITLIGFLTFLISKVTSMVKNNYSVIYIGNVFPIGVDHIFLHSIIASLIVVFVLAMLYCYLEAHTYCDYPEGKLNNCIQKANLFYHKLVIAIKLSFIITFLLFILMMLFPVINQETVIFLGIMVFCSVFIISLSLFFKWKKPFLNKFFSEIKRVLDARTELLIIYYWFLSLVASFIIILLLGLESNLNPNITVEFSSNGEIEITYSDTTTDLLPSEVVYRINGIEERIEESDFMTAGSTIVFSENRKILFNENNIAKQMFDEANVLFRAKVDVNEQLNEGVNNIEISFVINDFIDTNDGKKKYTIWNSIIKEENTLEVTKENFTFNIK